MRAGRRVWFLPKEMGDHLPKVNLNGWGPLPRPVPITCWFMYMPKHGKFQCAIEVGPIANPKIRIKLMELLMDAGFNFYVKGAMKDGAKYTRIVSNIKKLKIDEDSELDNTPESIPSFRGSSPKDGTIYPTNRKVDPINRTLHGLKKFKNLTSVMASYWLCYFHLFPLGTKLKLPNRTKCSLKSPFSKTNRVSIEV